MREGNLECIDDLISTAKDGSPQKESLITLRRTYSETGRLEIAAVRMVAEAVAASSTPANLAAMFSMAADYNLTAATDENTAAIERSSSQSTFLGVVFGDVVVEC